MSLLIGTPSTYIQVCSGELCHIGQATAQLYLHITTQDTSHCTCSCCSLLCWNKSSYFLTLLAVHFLGAFENVALPGLCSRYIHCKTHSLELFLSPPLALTFLLMLGERGGEPSPPSLIPMLFAFPRALRVRLGAGRAGQGEGSTEGLTDLYILYITYVQGH